MNQLIIPSFPNSSRHPSEFDHSNNFCFGKEGGDLHQQLLFHMFFDSANGPRCLDFLCNILFQQNSINA